jgi:multiple sugar transport system permease protein
LSSWHHCGVLPVLYVLYVGFFDWNAFSNQLGMQWAGVNNYRRLVFDEAFLDSLGARALCLSAVVTIEMSLGLPAGADAGQELSRAHDLSHHLCTAAHHGADCRRRNLAPADHPGFGPIPYFLDKWFGIDYRLATYCQPGLCDRHC